MALIINSRQLFTLNVSRHAKENAARKAKNKEEDSIPDS